MNEKIEVKSPATLIDELATAKIKLHVFTEQGQDDETLKKVAQRCLDLEGALDRVLESEGIGLSILTLIETNIKCFMAQEKLFGFSKAGRKEEAGEAAMEVHHLNAQRNNWIRAIDIALGHAEVTQLQKTYE